MKAEAKQNSESSSRGDPDQARQKSDNENRLGGYSPWNTIARLSLGPIISQVGASVCGIMDSFWANKYLGKSGLSAIGIAFVPQYLIHGFGQLISVAVTVKISYLHGRQAGGKIPSVLFDLFRISLLLGLIVPAIIIPITKPILSWMGAKEATAESSFLYIVPLSALFFLTSFYHLTCGVLQANGLSLYYGLAHLLCSILNMAAFDPFILGVVKSGAWGVSIAAVSSELLTSVAVVCFLRKKGLISMPEDRRFFGKFSDESISALKIGLSALVVQVAVTIPSGMVQKYLSQSSHAIGASTEVMGVWHLMSRVYNIVTSIVQALTSAVLPAISFAFGAKNPSRLLKLAEIDLCLGTLWSGSCSILFSLWPTKMCSLWISDSQFSSWIEKLIPPSTYTAGLCALRAVVSSLLQAMKMGHQASLLNLLGQLVALPIISAILYKKYPQNPEKLVWCYVGSDSTAFLLSIIFAIYPLKVIREMKKTEAAAQTPLLDQQ